MGILDSIRQKRDEIRAREEQQRADKQVEEFESKKHEKEAYEKEKIEYANRKAERAGKERARAEAERPRGFSGLFYVPKKSSTYSGSTGTNKRGRKPKYKKQKYGNSGGLLGGSIFANSGMRWY